ncbi:nuclear pore complex protein Nup50 [Musca domestica]|uniref:Nuclear pore complex protein Nup50 n=1 Tax=Musca domestica TaxID=7370 RepID=A0A9J7CM70_MUSDO|nr:nuclear pore complex protein Nup50 [Musca domestica]
MAGKRQATSDLNHDNWDREEEPEERGTFKTADEQELKNRVIKKAARRRVAGTDSADSGTKSVFSGFSGFGKPAATAATSTAGASPFSFLSKISSATPAPTSSATSETPKPAATTFSFGSSATATTTKTESAKEVKSDTKSSETSDEYYAKLKGLNQAVSEWIKTHVDKNPLCILTPIFKDYEKYLAELDEEKKKTGDKSTSLATVSDEKKQTTTATSSAGIGTFKFSETSTVKSSTTSTPLFSFSSGATTTSTGATTSTTKTNGFSFGLKKPEDTTDAKTTPAATTGFSFGLKPSTASSTSSTTSSTTSTTSAAPTFSFGKPASASDGDGAPKPFSFTPGGTPFSFGNIKPPEAPAPSTTENDEEDEEPPKNEFKQVVEDDAVYSKKCKVFVKKDGNFADKGVGTLYLKPIESSEKTQLIVRADTNLGNILVNLILSSAIPAQRMGKNNVMMVCIPTPDVEKPTPMLLRVKTGEEADELLATIEKYKK